MSTKWIHITYEMPIHKGMEDVACRVNAKSHILLLANTHILLGIHTTPMWYLQVTFFFTEQNCVPYYKNMYLVIYHK